MRNLSLAEIGERMGGFYGWSPNQLAHALGFRVNLRSAGGGQRTAYIERPSGRATAMGHTRACLSLSRLAQLRKLDPLNPPANPKRALINGEEQTHA